MQAAGVHEVGAGKPQRGGLFVHHGHERFLAPGDGLRQRLRRLRAGGDDRAVEQIPHRDRLAVDKPGHRRPGQIDGVDDGLRHGERRVQIREIFRRHQQRHDLRHGRGIDLRVRGLLCQYGPALHVDQHRGGGIELQIEHPRRLGRLRERQRGRLRLRFRLGRRLGLRFRLGFRCGFGFSGRLRLRRRLGGLGRGDGGIEIGLYELPVRVERRPGQKRGRKRHEQHDAQHAAAPGQPPVTQPPERRGIFGRKPGFRFMVHHKVSCDFRYLFYFTTFFPLRKEAKRRSTGGRVRVRFFR